MKLTKAQIKQEAYLSGSRLEGYRMYTTCTATEKDAGKPSVYVQTSDYRMGCAIVRAIREELTKRYGK